MTNKPLTLPGATTQQHQNFVVIQAQTYTDLERQLNELSQSHRIWIISSHIDNWTFFSTIALYSLRK